MLDWSMVLRASRRSLRHCRSRRLGLRDDPEGRRPGARESGADSRRARKPVKVEGQAENIEVIPDDARAKRRQTQR